MSHAICAGDIGSGDRFYPKDNKCYEAGGSPDGGNSGRRPGLVFPRQRPLSPHLAWLSLIQCGVPQIVFGQTVKGVLFILAFWLSLPTVYGPLVILAASIIDAYMVGTELRRGRPVGKMRFFPRNRKTV